MKDLEIWAKQHYKDDLQAPHSLLLLTELGLLQMAQSRDDLSA